MNTSGISSNSSPIVVCINDHPCMDQLLRVAAAEVESSGKPWHVLYVETPESAQAISRRKAERLLRILTQAERMGASIAKIEAPDVLSGIALFLGGLTCIGTGIPTVVIGQTVREGVWAGLHKALADRVAARLEGDVNLRIIPLPRFSRRLWARLSQSFYWGNRRWNLLAAPLAVALTLLGSESVELIAPNNPLTASYTNVSILFLLSSVFVAGRYGLLPGMLAALLSFLTVNFLYAPATYQIGSGPSSSLATLVLFLVASLAIAASNAYTLSFARIAQQQEQRTNALYRISRMAFSALTLQESLNILYRELRQMLHKDVAYFLPDALHLSKLVPAVPETLQLTEAEQESLQRCWRDSITTGVGTPEATKSEWRFEPMVSPRDRIGVLGIRIRPDEPLDPLLGRTLSLLAHQSAIVIERLELARAMEQSRLERERERLRSALLSSVSHDLKTPLASIIGALSVYSTMKAHLTEDRRDTLTQTALEEAQRLNSFISNIIDMARLESGETSFQPEWQPPQDLILRVKRAMRYRLKGHEILITTAGASCEILVDVAQTEQALQNILDNALKYSAPDAPIEIHLHCLPGEALEISVRDHGPGIPEAAQDTIFDKYTRLKKEDSQVAGTGLGLAIARAIITQQKGSIDVHNHPDGGAVFTVRFTRIRETLTTHEGQSA